MRPPRPRPSPPRPSGGPHPPLRPRRPPSAPPLPAPSPPRPQQRQPRPPPPPWELMKLACARWSAAMDQVRDAPPSGTVESDYETIAGMRYKEMAASKGKPFSFKHAWAILQTFDK
ncbi:putative methionyl-tRNA synthetase [Hordeum vulgare]|nr:putative methionyl-tRNA synthetase [Hordeum vulgare]